VERDDLENLGVGNNIKVHLQEIGLEVVDCIHFVQDKGQWQVSVCGYFID
jgi:hypothetical protein